MRKSKTFIDHNELVFKRDDIFKTDHVLSKLLRTIFYNNKITYGILSIKVIEHCNSENIFSNPYINSVKNNMIRVIKKDKITWDSFQKVIKIVFGYIIIDFTIECLNVYEDNDEIIVFSTKDKVKGE